MVLNVASGGVIDLKVNDGSIVKVEAATMTLNDGVAYAITHAASADSDDLTISQTGAHDASLLLTSAGTGTDAISLTATAGSMVLDVASGGVIDLKVAGTTKMLVNGDGVDVTALKIGGTAVTITTFGRSLIDDTDAAAAIATLGALPKTALIDTDGQTLSATDSGKVLLAIQNLSQISHFYLLRKSK